MKFDKKIFLDNMEFFFEKKGIRPTELEDAAGVSKGYLSRLKKEGNQSIPGIDFLLKSSEMFGISVEALSSICFSECSENEKYYINFFEKLIVKTEKKEIVWKNHLLKDFLNKIDKKLDEELIIEQEPSAMESLAGALSGKRKYKSAFEYGDYKYIGTTGEFYSLSLERGNVLYMVKVELMLLEDKFEGLEMFLISDHTKKSNVCCISPQNSQKYDLIFCKLYETVKESINVNAMDQETKSIIDDFMML